MDDVETNYAAAQEALLGISVNGATIRAFAGSQLVRLIEETPYGENAERAGIFLSALINGSNDDSIEIDTDPLGPLNFLASFVGGKRVTINGDVAIGVGYGSMVEALDGHAYIVRINKGVINYAKIWITSVTNSQVTMDWAYQEVTNWPELAPGSQEGATQ